MRRRLAASVLGAAMLAAPLTLCAAQAAGPPLRAIHDSVMHGLPIDGSRLQARQLVYRSTTRVDTTVSFLGEVRQQITETQYAGAPAWLVVLSGAQGVSSMSDSLVVAKADLRPLHWSAALGVARLAVEFTPDTIFGAMSSPLGRQNIVIGNRADLLVSAGGVDAVMSGLPLGADWHDSATVLVIDAGGTAIAQAKVTVEGEEHVSAPAGEYDCWIVSLETERGSARLWVSKPDQIVVRSEQPLPQVGGGAVLERLLLRVETPAVGEPPGVPMSHGAPRRSLIHSTR